MNAPHARSGARLAAPLSALATLTLFAACARSGRPPDQTSVTPSTATTPSQAEIAARRANASVLTAAEIASVPGIANALDAVQNLRPQFLRTRGSTARPASMVGAGAEGQAAGRRPGQVQGPQPGTPDAAGRGENAPSGARSAEDPGILVYIDRQRYGGVQTLRELPVAAIEEIRFLNAADANNLLGMGHPHGVIQIVTKRGAPPK